MKSIQKSKLNTTQKIMLELYEYCSCNKTIAREARIKPERLIQFIDGEAEANELEHDRLFILRCRYMSQDMQGEPLCEHDIENYVDIRGI